MKLFKENLDPNITSNFTNAPIDAIATSLIPKSFLEKSPNAVASE